MPSFLLKLNALSLTGLSPFRSIYWNSNLHVLNCGEQFGIESEFQREVGSLGVFDTDIVV